VSDGKPHLRIAEINPDYRYAGQEARQVAKNLREQAKRLRGEATALEDQAFRLESILEAEVSDNKAGLVEVRVIYSPNEASSNGAGFWSNEDGWVEDVKEATLFTAAEAKSMSLPMSTGNHASWCSPTDF
jgi:hypothetical protein